MRLPTKPIFPEPIKAKVHNPTPKPPDPPPKKLVTYFTPDSLGRIPAHVMGHPAPGKVRISIIVNRRDIEHITEPA